MTANQRPEIHRKRSFDSRRNVGIYSRMRTFRGGVNFSLSVWYIPTYLVKTPPISHDILEKS